MLDLSQDMIRLFNGILLERRTKKKKKTKEKVSDLIDWGPFGTIQSIKRAPQNLRGG